MPPPGAAVPTGPRRPGAARRRLPAPPRLGSRLLGVLVVLTGAVFLTPALFLLWESVRLGGDLLGVVTTPRVLAPLARSLLLAGSCAAACTALGTCLAVLVTRTDVVGAGALRVGLALPIVVPSFVGATALITATGRGGLVPFVPRPEGYWGAFLVLTVLTYPYVYLLVLARLRSTGRSQEEAARLLGAGTWRTLLTVTVPQVRQAASAGGLLVFLYVLSDFGAVALLRYDTITRAIYSTRLLDRTTSVTLGLFLAVLALVASAAARSARATPPTGRPAKPPSRTRLGVWRLPVSLLPWLVLVAGLVGPVVVFSVWSLRGSTTVGIGYSGPGDSLAFLVQPALNSAVAGVAAAVVAIVLVLPLAFASVRRPTSLTRGAVAVVTSVFALPGLLVALTLVFLSLSGPAFVGVLYQTFPLLVLGYVLHFGAQALRSAQAAVATVPERLDEAARTLGATGWRRFRTVDLPLVAPGLAAGAGLVMLSTIKELPATALLAPAGFQTLATRIFNAAQDGFFAEVGVTSLALLLVSGTLTWVLVLRTELGVSRSWRWRRTDPAPAAPGAVVPDAPSTRP